MLWPDTGKWYNADVIKVNVKKKTATLFYVDSDEREDINLYEAMLNMEVSWPYRGGTVGKTPLHSAAMPKKSQKRKELSSDSDDDDAARDSRVKKKPKAPAKKTVSVVKKTQPTGGPSDENRLTLRGKLLETMHLARDETRRLSEFGVSKTDNECEEAARATEAALFTMNKTDRKKYNDKARSLLFNLKDDKNPSLRARVLSGELKPEVLVTMTPAELARQDLQEMRRTREANIGEDAFLEGGPTVQRLVKTSKGEEMVVVGGGDEFDEGDGLGNRKEEQVKLPSVEPDIASGTEKPAAVEEDYTPRAPPTEEPATVDPAPAELPTFEAFAAGAASSDDEDDVNPEHGAMGKQSEEDDEYDPSKGFDYDADGDDEKAEDPEVGEPPAPVATKSAPPQAPVPADPPAPSKAPGTWTGVVNLSEGKIGKSNWRAAAIGGECVLMDLILPQTINIKGRVRLEKAEEMNLFLAEVLQGRSNSRGVTLAVAVPESKDDQKAAELTKWYASKRQYGVVSVKIREGPVPLEMYIVPQGKLLDKLVKVLGKTCEINPSTIAEEGPSAMLWCAVHPKGTGPNAVKKKAQPSAASLNAGGASSGGYNQSVYDSGGTPPRTVPVAYQSAAPHGAPPGYPPDMNQYGGYQMPPSFAAPSTYVTSVPPPPVLTRRPDVAEDFLNSTFGAAAGPSFVTDVPPPPFARGYVADVPPPPGSFGALPPPTKYDGLGRAMRDDFGYPPAFDDRGGRVEYPSGGGFDRGDDRRDSYPPAYDRPPERFDRRGDYESDRNRDNWYGDDRYRGRPGEKNRSGSASGAATAGSRKP